MSFFKVYRCFYRGSEELSRDNYVLSIVVSDTEADYVVNPLDEPERTLPFFRERLKRFTKNFGKPDSVDGWFALASFNLGQSEFDLVLELKKEDGPFANFEEIREREKALIENWLKLNIAPPSE